MVLLGKSTPASGQIVGTVFSEFYVPRDLLDPPKGDQISRPPMACNIKRWLIAGPANGKKRSVG